MIDDVNKRDLERHRAPSRAGEYRNVMLGNLAYQLQPFRFGRLAGLNVLKHMTVVLPGRSNTCKFELAVVEVKTPEWEDVLVLENTPDSQLSGKRLCNHGGLSTTPRLPSFTYSQRVLGYAAPDLFQPPTF